MIGSAGFVWHCRSQEMGACDWQLSNRSCVPLRREVSGRMKDVSLGDSDSSSLLWKHTPLGLLMGGRDLQAPWSPCGLRDIWTPFQSPPDTQGGGQHWVWRTCLSCFKSLCMVLTHVSKGQVWVVAVMSPACRSTCLRFRETISCFVIKHFRHLLKFYGMP